MKKRFLIATALTGVVAVSTPALAQSEGEQGQTQTGQASAADAAMSADTVIMVTARRRAESVQDVPIAIEAISAEQIAARGIANVEDIAKYTPGLLFDRGISLQDTRPVIRGLPATRGRPPVGVLLDGIDISTEALGNAGGGSLLNARLLDLERIEVVKGPQSALYGRAAFAGAINYITKRPTDEFAGEMRASIASFGTNELGFAIGGPISDNLGFRVNLAHAESDGDYDNPVGGGDLNAYQNTGGSLGLEYGAGTAFNAYFRVSYAEYEYSQSALQVLSGFTAGDVSRPGPTTPEGLAVAVGKAGGALSAFAQPSNTPPRQTLSFTGVTGLSLDPRTGEDLAGSDGSTFSATMNLSVDLGGFDLIYNGGYILQSERLIYDGDFVGVAPTTFGGGTVERFNLFDYVDFENETEIVNQEIRLQSLSTDPFRWAIGGLYWSSNTEQESRSVRVYSGFPAFGQPATPAQSATASFLASIGNVPASPFQRKIESLSAYALVEYDLTDALTFSAEARYIDEETTVVRSDFVSTLNAATFQIAPIPAGFVNASQSDQVSDDAVVPRFSISYQPNGDFLLYASAAKGFKPAGISELDFGSPDLADSRFKAETVWNYEVGAKTTLANGQVTLNGALFYMDWTDKQVSQLIESPGAPSGFRAAVVNAGAAEVYGIDASLVLRPDAVPGLTFDFGYTYLDAEYTDFSVLTNSAGTVTEGANCTIVQLAGSPVCQVTYNGNRLERAPKHQFTTNLNHRQELNSNVALILGASLQYQGSRFLTEANRLTLPSYVNIDAQIGVEVSDILVQGFVTNLTKEDAVRSAQNNFDLATFGRSVNLYAPPRRVFGLRVRAGF